jgi:hypothetical protein
MALVVKKTVYGNLKDYWTKNEHYKAFIIRLLLGIANAMAEMHRASFAHGSLQV